MSTNLLRFLNKLHDEAIEFLRDVRFDKRPDRDGYAVSLYASIIELCGGIIVLVSQDRKTAVSPVFRTLLEAYVDFKNAMQNSTYVKHAYAQHGKDWIKVSERATEPFPCGNFGSRTAGCSAEATQAGRREARG